MVHEPQTDESVCVGEKDDDDIEIVSWSSPASEGGEVATNNIYNLYILYENLAIANCFWVPCFFPKAPMPS